MSRFNQGIVFTNDRCVGCNKCKAVCPSLGANVTEMQNGKKTVSVSKKCIECGLCVAACDHHAREFRDDTERFFEDINNSEEISVMIDPAFYNDYGTQAFSILGMLRKLGVRHIYDVAFGGEISAFLHAKYLRENMNDKHQCKAFVANSCATTVTYIENLLPNVIPLIIPVHSPTMCTAIYARKYLHDNNKLALISPCLTQSSPTSVKSNGNLVSYNITFKNLSAYLKKVSLETDPKKPELYGEGPGYLLPFMNGFSDAVYNYLDKSEIILNFTGLTDEITQLLSVSSLTDTVTHPLMAVVTACKNGCVEGNGVSQRDICAMDLLDEYSKVRRDSFKRAEKCKDHNEYFEMEKERFSELDFNDFTCVFTDNYRQPINVPEDAINDIFVSMHKDSEEKRNVNCRSCGYKTCREMVVAVANGYARIQDCVHFMNDDLSYAALVDRMSGIPNLMGFRKAAREILDANPNKDYIVFVGNVNKLKNINDLYGVDVGDKVLDYIAKRLYEITDGKGTCGRFGGGIFGVFLEDRPDIISEFLKYDIIDARHIGVYFPVTIRYGMFRIKDHSIQLSDISNLCTYAADTATDRSRNTYIEFTEKMRNDMQIETDITLKMRDAMDRGEFVLFLQPQYDHHTGKIVGAEALSRWIKDDGSIVSPGLFIPVFEKNGFIKDMDRYVWETAFKLVKEWEDAGVARVPISVNISRISLEKDEIIDTIKELSEKYPIDKRHLYFEITETAYTSDQESITERIRKIKALGFEIAMDDFGSGYSSLNSLKDIPLDVLKLDMGFLRGGSNTERGNEIIAHVLEMAKALDLKIVGEGVETKDQADFLTDRGCDVIQGFYYARPMPINDYIEKLKTN